MKRLSITFGTILLVLGCFALSPAANGDPDGNTKVGIDALKNNTTGQGNTAIGCVEVTSCVISER